MSDPLSVTSTPPPWAVSPGLDADGLVLRSRSASVNAPPWSRMPPPSSAFPPLMVSPEMVTATEAEVMSKTRLESAGVDVEQGRSRPLDCQALSDRQLAAGEMDRLAVQAWGEAIVSPPSPGDLGTKRARTAVGERRDRQGAEHHPVFKGLQAGRQSSGTPPAGMRGSGERCFADVGLLRGNSWVEVLIREQGCGTIRRTHDRELRDGEREAPRLRTGTGRPNRSVTSGALPYLSIPWSGWSPERGLGPPWPTGTPFGTLGLGHFLHGIGLADAGEIGIAPPALEFSGRAAPGSGPRIPENVRQGPRPVARSP